MKEPMGVLRAATMTTSCTIFFFLLQQPEPAWSRPTRSLVPWWELWSVVVPHSVKPGGEPVR